jgi:putative DNA primase/helicase
LPGARMVRVSELEKGQKLKEALVKALTGGEPFLARHLHKGFFEVRPVFKPVLSSNHKPDIYGTDEGIWRRVNIVPWDVTIPAEERRPFEEVVREMVAEGSGILNWLIAGLAQYVRDGGLRPPAEVRAATDEHRDDMDPMARFVRHCLIVRSDIEMSDAPDWQPPEAVRVGARQLFEAFNQWLVANGAKPWGETAFGRQMGERAETFGFRRFDKRVRYYAPIELHDVPEWSPESADPGWSPP